MVIGVSSAASSRGSSRCLPKMGIWGTWCTPLLWWLYESGDDTAWFLIFIVLVVGVAFSCLEKEEW